MSKTITISDETYLKLKNQLNEDKEEKKLEIKNKFTGEVIFSSYAKTMKDVVKNAISEDISLRGADLKDTNLCHAQFYGKGGGTRIKQDQVADFMKALGVIVE